MSLRFVADLTDDDRVWVRPIGGGFSDNEKGGFYIPWEMWMKMVNQVRRQKKEREG